MIALLVSFGVTFGLEPLVYLLLGAGAVLAYRSLVGALMRWRWLVGDDPHPAVGQTRSHVRVVREDGFTAVRPSPNASADVSHTCGEWRR